LEQKQNVFRRIYDNWGGGVSFFFCFIHFSHDLSTGLLLALLPFIKAEFDLNYFQSGLLVSAFAIMSGFSQILGGWLGDKVKRWKMVAIGLMGIGLTSMAIGFSSTYLLLLIVLFIMGIFAGAYHPSAVPALSSFFEDKRGKALGLHMIGGSIGFGLGPFLGTAIATAFNWHTAFIFMAIPSLAASAFVFLWLKNQGPLAREVKKVNRDKAAADGEKRASLAPTVKSLALIMGLIVAAVFTSGSLLAFVPLYLVDYFGFTNNGAAIWLGVIRAIGIAGSLLGGWLSDRWGVKKTVILTIAGTGPVMIMFAYLPWGVGMAAALLLIGMLMPMRETAAQTYIMGKTPIHLQGMVFGIYFGIGMQGQSLLQPVYGGIMDAAGMPAVFQVVALLSLAVSIISLAVAKKL
jgi:MFS transporter, FSR family, fosmidomycin resistance protein